MRHIFHPHKTISVVFIILNCSLFSVPGSKCARQKIKVKRAFGGAGVQTPATRSGTDHGASPCIFMRNLPESAMGKFPGGPNVRQQASYYHVERIPWQHLFISQLAGWIFLGLDLEREASKRDTLESQTTAAAE